MQVNSLVSGDVHLDVWVTELDHHWFRQWLVTCSTPVIHYNNIIMSAMTSQITTIIYSSVYSGADQRKHQSPASLAFVWGIHRWPVNSPHKGPVTRNMFRFDDVIMIWIDADLIPIQIAPMHRSKQFWILNPKYQHFVKSFENVCKTLAILVLSFDSGVKHVLIFLSSLSFNLKNPVHIFIFKTIQPLTHFTPIIT